MTTPDSTRNHIGLLTVIREKPHLVAKHMRRFEADRHGCHLWTGATRRGKGSQTHPDARYGVVSFKIGCKSWKIITHRLAYAVRHNIDPGSAQVCHTCDNPLCINPDHLILGNVRDNMVDMIQKERGTAVLTIAEVLWIAARLSTHSDKDLAELVGSKVNHQAVRDIRTGRTWWHVTGIDRAA